MTLIKAILSGLKSAFLIILSAILTISIIVFFGMAAGVWFKLAQTGFNYTTQLLGNFL